MRSRPVNPTLTRIRLTPAHIAIAGIAVLIATSSDRVGAVERQNQRTIEFTESRSPGEPILAVVSLQKQRITIYDSIGWIVRAPVSSGQKGRETPAGIFSIIQKEADHYSNLYDDAFMPHMQRITWSGIALHGGALPGYPASHGCVRMPFDFAAQLFEETRLGLRVIVARSDPTPVEIAHPVLLFPKPVASTFASARIAEGNEATRKADQARHAAGMASREAAQATIPLRVAENLKRRAEAQLSAADVALGSATSEEAKDQAESTKAQAIAKIAELEARVTVLRAELQPKLDAVTAAREAIVATEATRVAAAEAARQANRELEPVSILVSRKTQRLYVRQAFEPVFDMPITVLDADRPIGTHVFTLMERTDNANMRWSVVSLDSSAQTGGSSDPGPVGAKAALDRVVIPQDALDRIVAIAPRSSLIVTDEPLSSETGKGTDFVVLMSGEPQGGIKMRRRSPANNLGYARAGDRLPYWRSPYLGQFSTW
jgi:L,D-transpeptidase catalytic domain